MDFLRQWIGIILVILGLVRAVLLVAHDPLMGYASQGDMNGTSACVGLFPANEAVALLAATPDAPIALYHLGTRTKGCYRSTEVTIVATTVAIARALGTDTSRFRLQWIGYAKLALLFATALAVAWALRDHLGASLVHGLVVVLVVSDPIVTLWFNTLYREFATIWGAYAIIAAACILALSEKQAFAWALLLIALVALAFSREHYSLLGLLLVAGAWPWLWYRSQRMTLVTALVAVVAWIVSFVVLQREGAPSFPAGDFEAAARSMAQALPSMKGVSPAHLGTLEGARLVPLHDLPWWAYSPLDAGASLIPAAVFTALALATFMVAPLALLALVVMRRWRGDPLAPLLLAILLGAVAIHAFATTLFGRDGRGGAALPARRLGDVLRAGRARGSCAGAHLPLDRSAEGKRPRARGGRSRDRHRKLCLRGGVAVDAAARSSLRARSRPRRAGPRPRLRPSRRLLARLCALPRRPGHSLAIGLGSRPDKGNPVGTHETATFHQSTTGRTASQSRERFLAGCEPVELALGETLAKPGKPIRHVYFPTESYVSLVTQVGAGRRLEVALVATKACSGCRSCWGSGYRRFSPWSRAPGRRGKWALAGFVSRCADGSALRRGLNGYFFVRMSRLGQTAGCIRFHVVEQRLARWLSVTSDRAHSANFHMTHSLLAYLLGVRRVGITKAATSLQYRNLITYTRGNIEILDRKGLERASCRCYGADLETDDRVLG